MRRPGRAAAGGDHSTGVWTRRRRPSLGLLRVALLAPRPGGRVRLDGGAAGGIARN